MSDDNDATNDTSSQQGAFSADSGDAQQGGELPATQAELNRLIGDRVARERAKFSDYDDIKGKAAEYDKVVEANKTEQQRKDEELENLRSQVAGYESEKQITAWRDEVAAETGVPAHLLRGSSKEELQEHAAALQSFTDSNTATPTPQPIPGEGRQVATPLNGDGIESALKSALGIK